MNTTPVDLPAAPLRQGMDRRGFLATAAKGLLVAFTLPAVGRFGEAAAATVKEQAVAFVHIGSDGTITLLFGGAEMGQGSSSGLPVILAEELMVDLSQITVVQSLVDPIVSYTTGGSSAVSRRYTTLRNAGAAARELLIAAAMAAKGDLIRDNYEAKSAVVRHIPSGTTWTYGALAVSAAGQSVPTDLRLTDPSRFRLIGKPNPRFDIPAKVNGSAKYGIDTWSQDMVFAAIKHCPTIGGTLKTMPTKPSSAIALVACTASDSRGKVVAGSTNAVAVVASNTWLAFKLAKSLNVSWNLPASTADVDTTQIQATAQTALASGAALVAEPAVPTGYTPGTYAPVMEKTVGDALGASPIAGTFTVPYLAHGTMEVMNCTVDIDFDPTGTKPVFCEIWAPTQSATSVANNAAKLTGLPTSAIVVHTTFLGGGLGRKIEQDYIWQAIQVGLAVKRPVKLTWERPEDFGHDQYRPLAVTQVKARLSGNRIAAWSYRTVSQSITAQRGRLAAGAVDSQAVEGAVRLGYDLGTSLVEWVPLNVGIPIGYWRSVGASINTFVVESMMDKLAAAVNRDPFLFRYDHLANNPRWHNVLWQADLLSQSWRTTLASGHQWGVAIGEAFGTCVAEVVEISLSSTGALRIHRVDCVVDCGTVINPDSVEAQMQGGIVHGLNAALWGRTTFTAGKANELNFNRNRVLRLNEMPVVRVQIIQSSNPPSGIGEPGVPPVAPALANAYARLTGQRPASLPLFPGATMGGL